MRRFTAPPGVGAPRHPTRRGRGLLAVALAGSALGCAAVPSPDATSLPGAAPSPGSLRIRLVFDDAADLDLYVTDPHQETVYFANTPTRTGGALERDVRCDADAGPRVETIAFPAAPAGRYRVGVDFAERCRLPARPVEFTLIVDGAGVAAVRRGRAELGVFEAVVLEFDVPGAGP